MIGMPQLYISTLLGEVAFLLQKHCTTEQQPADIKTKHKEPEFIKDEETPDNTAKMMPQPPHHKEDQPRGLTDQTVDAAHDFMEHAEEDREKVRSVPCLSSYRTIIWY